MRLLADADTADVHVAVLIDRPAPHEVAFAVITEGLGGVG